MNFCRVHSRAHKPVIVARFGRAGQISLIQRVGSGFSSEMLKCVVIEEFGSKPGPSTILVWRTGEMKLSGSKQVRCKSNFEAKISTLQIEIGLY